MNVMESLRSAIDAILANRLRSALTMLGIMIGVAAVIVLVAFGQGASNSITGSIQSLGTNLLTVTSVSSSTADGGTVVVRDLTVDDARALNDPIAAPDVAAAAPVRRAQAACTFGGSSHPTAVNGTWPAYFEISNSPVSDGTYFTNDDQLAGRRVIVIGTTVAESLFGDADPLGETIACGGTPFTVVGILAAKGGSGFGDADDTAIAPLSAVQNHLTGYGPVTFISVQAASPEAQGRAQAQVTDIIDLRHGTDDQTRDIQIFNQANLLTIVNTALGIFTTLLGAVAAISLLVGGIGITNIMLVSVTERTREIGIRKAIGASRRVILLQFLLEATVLSVLGATAGLALAFLATRIEVVGIRPTIVPSSVVLAYVVSIAIGLFFGSWPARRAASLRPIEALRHE